MEHQYVFVRWIESNALDVPIRVIPTRKEHDHAALSHPHLAY